MGLLATMRAWLAPVIHDPSSASGILRRHGASRELIRFAEPFGRDLTSLWAECPRASWALEIAARGGVDRRLVAHAVGDLLDDLESAHAQEAAGWWATERSQQTRSMSAEEITQARQLAGCWVKAEASTHELCLHVEALCLLSVDLRQDVRKALADVEEAMRWGRLQEMLSLSEQYDGLYAAARQELAVRIRRRIPVELVRVAFSGLSPHPYR